MPNWGIRVPEDYVENDKRACIDCKFYKSNRFSGWHCINEKSKFDIRQENTFLVNCDLWELTERKRKQTLSELIVNWLMVTNPIDISQEKINEILRKNNES